MSFVFSENAKKIKFHRFQKNAKRIDVGVILEKEMVMINNLRQSRLLCISTSFWALPKAGRNLFLSCFSTFFVHFKTFSGFDQLSGAHSTRKLVEIHNKPPLHGPSTRYAKPKSNLQPTYLQLKYMILLIINSLSN